jgi:hypothetical protein
MVSINTKLLFYFRNHFECIGVVVNARGEMDECHARACRPNKAVLKVETQENLLTGFSTP